MCVCTYDLARIVFACTLAPIKGERIRRPVMGFGVVFEYRVFRAVSSRALFGGEVISGEIFPGSEALSLTQIRLFSE